MRRRSVSALLAVILAVSGGFGLALRPADTAQAVSLTPVSGHVDLASTAGVIPASAGQIRVRLWYFSNGWGAASTFTDAQGAYVFPGEWPGTYWLQFDDSTATYATQYSNGSATAAAVDFDHSSSFTLSSGEGPVVVNATMPLAGSAHGTIGAVRQGALSDWQVWAWYSPDGPDGIIDPQQTVTETTAVAPDGTWSLPALDTGSYVLQYHSPLGAEVVGTTIATDGGAVQIRPGTALAFSAPIVPALIRVDVSVTDVCAALPAITVDLQTGGVWTPVSSSLFREGESSGVPTILLAGPGTYRAHVSCSAADGSTWSGDSVPIVVGQTNVNTSVLLARVAPPATTISGFAACASCAQPQQALERLEVLGAGGWSALGDWQAVSPILSLTAWQQSVPGPGTYRERFVTQSGSEYLGTSATAIVPSAGATVSVGTTTLHRDAGNDFDGDGTLDAMGVVGAASSLSGPGGSIGQLALFDYSAATFAATRAVGTGWQSMSAVLQAPDWDGSGHPDVLARTTSGQLLLYRGNGSGGWTTGSGQTVGSGWQSMTAMAMAPNFDGDGSGDLLARDTAGRLLLYRGDGHGGWITGSGLVVGTGWSGFTKILVPGDVNHDGSVDVIGITPDGRMYLYEGNGDGGWTSGTGILIGAGWNGFAQVVPVGAFDGSAMVGLLGVDATGRARYYSMTTTPGVWQQPQGLSLQHIWYRMTFAA